MNEVENVFQSYGRSCNHQSFYDDFYVIFISKSDEIRAMFDKADMDVQRRLFQGSITWLVMRARGMNDSKIRALGKSHSRAGLNIHPSYYRYWLDALVETLHKHDPEFNAELEDSWRRVLQPSIEQIQSMY